MVYFYITFSSGGKTIKKKKKKTYTQCFQPSPVPDNVFPFPSSSLRSP